MLQTNTSLQSRQQLKKQLEPLLTSWRKISWNIKNHPEKLEIEKQVIQLIEDQLNLPLLFFKTHALSFMESLCVALFAMGQRRKQVADIMNIAIGTVDTYERRIRKKLSARNRQEMFFKIFLSKNGF